MTTTTVHAQAIRDAYTGATVANGTEYYVETQRHDPPEQITLERLSSILTDLGVHHWITADQGGHASLTIACIDSRAEHRDLDIEADPDEECWRSRVYDAAGIPSAIDSFPNVVRLASWIRMHSSHIIGSDDFVGAGIPASTRVDHPHRWRDSRPA